MIHTYSLVGEYMGLKTKEELIKYNSKKSKSMLTLNINTALNGYKGYGYYEGIFISNDFVEILTNEQEMLLFNKWCSKNLKKLKSEMKRYTRFWNDDMFQECLLLLCEDILSPRGVNDPERYIKFKYKACVGDDHKKNKALMRQNESSDFDIIDDNGHEQSYIGIFAEESLFDNGETESCIKGVNYLKQLEILEYVLLQFFHEDIVKMYMMVECKSHKHRNKYKQCIDYFGLSQVTIRNRISNIKNELINLKPLMNKLFEELRYPTFDEMSLYNIIND